MVTQAASKIGQCYANIGVVVEEHWLPNFENNFISTLFLYWTGHVFHFCKPGYFRTLSEFWLCLGIQFCSLTDFFFRNCIPIDVPIWNDIGIAVEPNISSQLSFGIYGFYIQVWRNHCYTNLPPIFVPDLLRC